MKKITRMVLISVIFVTSGLTAKVATENYKAVATNDKRIHKAYELAKKPNKAAVLEAIVDATNAEPDEHIRDAVVLEPEEETKTPKAVRVTTSAGVSPIASVMDKKTVNKAEEFIEKVAHPAEVVMTDILAFSVEDIPGTSIPVQELKYETKDIFPEFEELTYKIKLFGEMRILGDKLNTWHRFMLAGIHKNFIFDVKENIKSSGARLSTIILSRDGVCISDTQSDGIVRDSSSRLLQDWDLEDNDINIVKFDLETWAIDYSSLIPFKNSNEPIQGYYMIEDGYDIPTYKQVYDFLVGVETGKYPLLKEI